MVLAGGASRRMGRDKALARIGGRTQLALVRQACRDAGLPCRVLRRDLVPGLGPLGGIDTALSGTSADVVVVLSCDMPFITPALLRKAVRAASAGAPRAVLFQDGEGAGFPLVLRPRHRRAVARLLQAGRRSVQALAASLRPVRLRLAAEEAWRRFNVNTPADLAEARRLWRESGR